MELNQQALIKLNQDIDTLMAMLDEGISLPQVLKAHVAGIKEAAAALNTAKTPIKKKYMFYVAGTLANENRYRTVFAESEKEAHTMVWNMFTQYQQDNISYLECIDEEAV